MKSSGDCYDQTLAMVFVLGVGDSAVSGRMVQSIGLRLVIRVTGMLMPETVFVVWPTMSILRQRYTPLI